MDIAGGMICAYFSHSVVCGLCFVLLDATIDVGTMESRIGCEWSEV